MAEMDVLIAYINGDVSEGNCSAGAGLWLVGA